MCMCHVTEATGLGVSSSRQVLPKCKSVKHVISLAPITDDGMVAKLKDRTDGHTADCPAGVARQIEMVAVSSGLDLGHGLGCLL